MAQISLVFPSSQATSKWDEAKMTKTNEDAQVGDVQLQSKDENLKEKYIFIYNRKSKDSINKFISIK